MLKHHFPLEKPVGSIADPALQCFDAVSSGILAATVKEGPAKRLRKSPSKGIKSPAATGALERTGWIKRSRLSPPEESKSNQDELPDMQQAASRSSSPKD